MPNPIRGVLAGVATAFTLSEPAGADGVAYGMSSPVAITALAIDRTTSPITIYSSVPLAEVDFAEGTSWHDSSDLVKR